MKKRIALALLLLSLFATLPVATQQPTPVEIKIDPAKFDPYVGQYEDAANLGGTILSFFREGEMFFVQGTYQEKVEIFPSAENKFFLTAFPAAAEFLRDSGGRVT